MSQKREMPENIRKMFEQKNIESNNFSEQQKQEEKPEISQNEPQVEQKSTVENLPQEQQTEKIPSAIQKENKVQKPPKKPKSKSEKKNKDGKKTKKKLPKAVKIILILVAIAVVVALSIILPIFFKKQQDKRLSPPTLQVYNLSNQTILYVDENKNATGYYFAWEKQENGEWGEVLSTPSPTNQLSLNSKLNDQVGKYRIWAKYILGDTNSKESAKVEITFTKQLAKVDIKKIEGDILTFSKVDNASYYKIFYDGKNYIQVNQQSEIGDIKVNLSELFLENEVAPNLYNIYVQAIGSEQTFYTDSELSSSKEYAYKTKLEQITSATYQKSTNILEFYANQTSEISNFQITIIFSDNTTQILEKTYKITDASLQLDLTSTLSTFEKTSQDVRKISIVTYSYDEYIQNSDSVNAIIVD